MDIPSRNSSGSNLIPDLGTRSAASLDNPPCTVGKSESRLTIFLVERPAIFASKSLADNNK
jgi:hypothetical protein